MARSDNVPDHTFNIFAQLLISVQQAPRNLFHAISNIC